MGDRPMSALAVEGTGNGKRLIRRSNSAGFANFTMSASDLTKDVTFPGNHLFQLEVPPGWHVTTGNADQNVRFELFPSAPADRRQCVWKLTTRGGLHSTLIRGRGRSQDRAETAGSSQWTPCPLR